MKIPALAWPNTRVWRVNMKLKVDRIVLRRSIAERPRLMRS
jgi:hypothetical protein